MSYVIIKYIENESIKKTLPVIILDSQGEVLEFETKDDAQNMCNAFQVNSDSGYIYQIKKIGG
jgi:hypothetical protein